MTETRRVCVRGLIKHNGALFAQRLKNHQGENDFWCTPGGGVDSLENLHDALRREMIEETGVTPEIGRLVLVQQFGDGIPHRHGYVEQLEFFFEITNPQDYFSINLTDTTHGEVEIAEYGFIDPQTTNILPTILHTPAFKEVLVNPAAQVLFHTDLPSSATVVTTKNTSI